MNKNLIREYSEDVLSREHTNLKEIAIEEENNTAYYFARKAKQNMLGGTNLLRVIINDEETSAQITYIDMVSENATFRVDENNEVIISRNVIEGQEDIKLLKLASFADKLTKTLIENGIIDYNDLVVEEINCNVK